LKTGDGSTVSGNTWAPGATKATLQVGDGSTTGEAVIRGNVGPDTGLEITARGRALVADNKNLSAVDVGKGSVSDTPVAITNNSFFAGSTTDTSILIRPMCPGSLISGNTQLTSAAILAIVISGNCEGTRITGNYTNGGDVNVTSPLCVVSGNNLNRKTSGLYGGDITINSNAADTAGGCTVMSNILIGGNIRVNSGQNTIMGNILVRLSASGTIDPVIPAAQGLILLDQTSTPALWETNVNVIIGNIYRSYSTTVAGPYYNGLGAYTADNAFHGGTGVLTSNEDLCRIKDVDTVSDVGVSTVFRRLNIEE
jgi:hypothetical protein